MFGFRGHIGYAASFGNGRNEAATVLGAQGSCNSGISGLEAVHDQLHVVNWGTRKRYPSDISKEAFEEIRPLLESVRKQTKPRTVDLYEVFCGVLYLLKSGCRWRMLPSEYPKWRTVHAYFAKWSEPGPDGFSVLERALKKCGWRGPYKTGAQSLDELFDRRRTERQEHR